MNLSAGNVVMSKLFLGLFSILAITAAVVIIAYVNMTAMTTSQDDLYRRDFAVAVGLKDIRSNQNATGEDIVVMLVTDKPSLRELRKKDIKQRTKEVDDDLENVSAILKDDPVFSPELQRFIELRNAFSDTNEKRIIPMILSGRKDEAKVLVLGDQAELSQRLRAIANNLIGKVEKRAEERVVRSRQAADRSIRIFVILGVAALMLGAAISYFMKMLISARARAEEKLRASSAYARSLIEASLDPLVTISPEGKITDVNESTANATGVARENLIGTDFSTYFTEPEKAREGYRRVFEQGFVTDYPLTIRHANGRLMHVHYNASIYKDAGGQVAGVFAVARDVSERKRMEEELRAASLYTRSLIEASLDPLVTISLEGKITDVNRATEAATGVPRERLVGSDFSDYFMEPDKAREGYLKAISAGFVKDYPLTLHHAAGGTMDVVYNASVYAGEGGKMQGIFAAARDITERKRMEEDLKRLLTEVQKSASNLVSSVSEILATTTQVATGMSETATSMSETTSTVEEVKQTAMLSSDKSRGVSESAQKAVQVAQRGNAAVTETVEGINHIKGLMETVAETLVKLSEQTQSIGEIIAAVNDLAQQSNLLAVNAAIEAAKAGEQGKGFTVVAQEIKSLSDQSKQSTEQVRAILTDIQKATSAAVMAAEQVSKAVEAGVKKSNEAGESISKLSESITEAAQTAVQIAASSQQQLVGMEQVALAMENIKQATQQNVAGIKQAEQAAHNLNELGQKLKELAGRYKV